MKTAILALLLLVLTPAIHAEDKPAAPAVEAPKPAEVPLSETDELRLDKQSLQVENAGLRTQLLNTQTQLADTQLRLARQVEETAVTDGNAFVRGLFAKYNLKDEEYAFDLQAHLFKKKPAPAVAPAKAP